MNMITYTHDITTKYFQYYSGFHSNTPLDYCDHSCSSWACRLSVQDRSYSIKMATYYFPRTMAWSYSFKLVTWIVCLGFLNTLVRNNKESSGSSGFRCSFIWLLISTRTFKTSNANRAIPF